MYGRTEYLMRAIVKSVIKSVKKERIRNKRGSAPCSVLEVRHTTRVFNKAFVEAYEYDHTPFPSRPDILYGKSLLVWFV